MAAITDAAMVTLWNECIQAIATGQSYEINGRRMTRADLPQALKTLQFFERRVALANSSPSTQGIGLASFGDPT